MDSYLEALVVSDEGIPLAVQRCAQRLAELNVWWQFSRNEPAMSCQDAAQKRRRLGHRGIPLRDELKSFLGEYECDGTRRFLAHCRGNREVDLQKIGSALTGATGVRRSSSESIAKLGAAYGVVNPFTIADDVVQIFDDELRDPMGVPGTVMTNAGDHTWAVEFEPAELVAKLAKATWADIVDDSNPQELPGTAQTIGVLTGNPCDSGLELCMAINTHFRRLLGRNSLGDVSMPRIVLVSNPQIGISMEMDSREAPLRRALLNAVDELCSMGATIIGHPAHTTHYFGSDLAQPAYEKNAMFISMAEATAQRIRQTGVQEITLLGTRFVTDPDSKWSVYNQAFEGLTVHRPSQAGWIKIHDLGYEVQQNGLTPLSFNWMRDLLRDEVPASCKDVVLVMTEFAPVVRQLRNRGRHGKNLIEPIDIYGEAIARAYMSAMSVDCGGGGCSGDGDLPGDSATTSVARLASDGLLV